MPIPVPLLEALRLGTSLAVELPTGNPERLAGVIIVPIREAIDRQARTEGWRARVPDRRFLVRWREYDKHRVENNDWNIGVGEGIWELRSSKVVGEAALEHLLLEWEVPFERLTYLWNTKLPE